MYTYSLYIIIYTLLGVETYSGSTEIDFKFPIPLGANLSFHQYVKEEVEDTSSGCNNSNEASTA